MWEFVKHLDIRFKRMFDGTMYLIQFCGLVRVYTSIQERGCGRDAVFLMNNGPYVDSDEGFGPPSSVHAMN